MMPSPDDASLVSQILRGEIECYASLVERYDRRVRGIIRLSIRDAQACEDIVQQVFYIAFRSLSDLREGGSLAPWLITIAHRCVADHLRKRAPEITIDYPASLAAPEARKFGWLWVEVRRLPLTFAEVLTLRYRDCMSYEEIATELQVPISTVRGRIFEARRALRRRMDKEQFS